MYAQKDKVKELLKRIPRAYNLVKKIHNCYQRMHDRNRLKKDLAKYSSRKVVLGAGELFDKGWIPTNITCLDILNPCNWEQYFSPASIDAMLSEHVWEHMTEAEGAFATKMCFKYLKPGGYLRAAVPDGLHPEPQYIEQVKVGGIGSYAWDHKVLYTYKTFQKVFENAGFKVDLYEFFDEAGQFHYTEWNPEEGKTYRSKRFDKRNSGETLTYTSIILDAKKL